LTIVFERPYQMTKVFQYQPSQVLLKAFLKLLKGQSAREGKTAKALPSARFSAERGVNVRFQKFAPTLWLHTQSILG
jgi:hypothetical protein